jgi:hypothetical protein
MGAMDEDGLRHRRDAAGPVKAGLGEAPAAAFSRPSIRSQRRQRAHVPNGAARKVPSPQVPLAGPGASPRLLATDPKPRDIRGLERDSSDQRPHGAQHGSVALSSCRVGLLRDQFFRCSRARRRIRPWTFTTGLAAMAAPRRSGERNNHRWRGRPQRIVLLAFIISCV